MKDKKPKFSLFDKRIYHSPISIITEVTILGILVYRKFESKL